VTACCFSPCGEYVACCDISDDHNLYLISVRSGQVLNKAKTGGYKVLDVAWHSSGEGASKVHSVAVAGIKTLKVFVFQSVEGALKGKSCDMKKRSNYPSCTFTKEGKLIVGGSSGYLYVLTVGDGLKCGNPKKVHQKAIHVVTRTDDG
jgi:WD40 repeat protein